METGVPPSAEMLEYSNWTLLEQGRKLSALDLMSALKKVNAVSRSFAAFFENHDIWLTPTMGALPPLLGYLDSSFFGCRVAYDPLLETLSLQFSL